MRDAFPLPPSVSSPGGRGAQVVAGTLALLMLALVAAVLYGCAGTEETLSSDEEPDAASFSPVPEEDRRAGLRYCVDAPPPSGLDTKAWRTSEPGFPSGFGRPRHAAYDGLATPGASITLGATFRYGPNLADLEDEVVELWMDDCSGAMTRWRQAATDSDGHVDIDLQPEELPEVGVYRLMYRVPGDNSFDTAFLRVLPEGTRLAILDIDGTISAEGSLGTLGGALFGATEEPRPGAAETTRRLRELGWEPVYLTARFYVFEDYTRRWLSRHGFAPGTLHFVRHERDALPRQRGTGDFKLGYLGALQDRGFEIGRAYGNTSTDLHAYRGVGLPPERIFMFGDYEGAAGLGDSFEAHLERLQAEAPVPRPWMSTTD